jgi:hypothetical protein
MYQLEEAQGAFAVLRLRAGCDFETFNAIPRSFIHIWGDG